ncbi:VanZ family protein [Chryseomicrobium palamuruense]|uniref:VanZ family protein n=1 Tax=Chryseomicrobium palamuruense TaxID=682973 RepID=A0ABV8UUJ0_9BACL
MKWVRVFAWMSFAGYLVVLLTLLYVSGRFGSFTDYSFAEKIRYASNFVPLATIREYITAYQNETLNLSIIVRNLGGNLIAFTPFGFFLPLLFRRLRPLMPFLLTFIAILFVIESVQLLTMRGSFDVDDFILNIPSALMGWGLYQLGEKLVKQSRWELKTSG